MNHMILSLWNSHAIFLPLTQIPITFIPVTSIRINLKWVIQKQAERWRINGAENMVMKST